MNLKPCHVYVILICGLDLRKIGVSENPKSRLCQLSTGSPFEMEIERTYPFPSRKEAEIVEAIFHEENQHRQSRGEWFNIDNISAQDGIAGAISRFIIERKRWISIEEFEQEMARFGCPDSGTYFYEIDEVAA